ncbi:hypothetical protein KPG71_18705 [Roseovarius sp. PS-C2]|uniref:host specificity factor TipJ family phage tail protein n=1 Tax=Roseovarius sp. PS-C2 TaxID=2820814 RepID=UPI001C0C7055|nr:host specificity factor TipJ family phage tail protein [Roseovarius sp. PS-C2]MBU3262056.1 hypothetical protein [Roseovarius sp. PS-C2]
MQAELTTVAQRHPLETRASYRKAYVGMTVAEIVAQHDLPERMGLPVAVVIRNGHHWVVPSDMWGRVRPKEGTRVEIGYPLQGPAIGAIAAAVVSAAAPAIATSVFGLAAGSFAFSLAVAGISIVGALLVQALIPPPSQKQTPQFETPQNYSVTGVRNTENRYGIYPKVLGRYRLFPPKSARGYTETVGQDIYYRGRVAVGWGPVALSDIRIGTTPITEFEGIEIEFLNVDQTETLSLMPDLSGITVAWRTGTEALTLMPDNIFEDPYNVKLNKDEPIIRTTREATRSAAVDITFPQGLAFLRDNNTLPGAIGFSFEYRKVGDTTWIDAGGEVFRGASTSLLRFTKQIALPSEGEWEIRVNRNSVQLGQTNILDDSYLSGIRSIRSGGLPSHDGIAEIAFRLKASDELNGQVDTLNMIAHQMAPVWDGSSWSAPQRVRHPAWIFADAIKGPHLRRPVPDSRIDLDALKAWADEETHWTCDTVVDTGTQLAEVLDLICATGRAKKTLADLKYSVILDGAQGPIRQVFSPRNSWGFKGAVTFPREIHAFRCKVVSERLEWQEDEITVYADGYNALTATEIETLPLPGVVVTESENDEGNAWRLARYHLAQAILRPEQFEWNSDWEAMRVTRGDKVQLVHDVPSIGVGAGRLKSFTSSGGVVDTMTLDESFELGTEYYRLTVRQDDGTRHEVFAQLSAGVWTVFSGTINDTDIANGDLVVVEEATQETMEVLVTGVYPNPDGSARLTGVPAAPAVLDADSGTIPPYLPIVTVARSNPNFGPPRPVVRTIVSDQNTAQIERGGSLQARAALFLDPFASQDSVGASLQLRWRREDGSEWAYGDMQIPGSPAIYTGPLETGQDYRLEVRAVGDLGKFRGWVDGGVITAAISDVPPSTVTGWQVVPAEGFVQMQWDDPTALDMSHVEIRYTSAASGSWNASTLIGKVPYPKLTESAFARAGTYMIKWVDRGGQKSTTAASVTISSQQLKAANAAATQTVSPTFSGTFSDTEVVSGELRLLPDGSGNYPASGTWTSDTPVDLGAKYPVRITPNIEASAFSPNDVIANWPVLVNLASLAPSNPDSWGLTVEVAFSDSDPTGGTDWKPLTGGDYLGRYFNFRVSMTSDRTDTTPRVSLLEFVLDMPDRVEGTDGVSSGTGGLSVTYTPAFRETPAVVISPINLPSGGYAQVTNESRTGFDVEFFNASDTSIDVVFNWVARGYGREQA